MVPLVLAVAVFAGMMAVSFAHKAYSMLTEAETLFLEEPDIRTQLGLETAIGEGIDTLLVLIGLLVISRPPAAKRPNGWLLAWLLGGPILLAALAMNVGYHIALSEVVARFQDEPQEMINLGWQTEGWWAVFLVCVQPALIEELYFRHLLLGHLRPHVGTHAAVWIAAAVFGMAHLHAVASWPVLILIGVGLGYARVYSGGLALPVILHFLHNLAILGIEA